MREDNIWIEQERRQRKRTLENVRLISGNIQEEETDGCRKMERDQELGNEKKREKNRARWIETDRWREKKTGKPEKVQRSRGDR